MSTRYPGGFINRSAPVIVGPVDGEGGSAPGVWTLEQASYYTKQGTWPQKVKDRPLYAWGRNTQGQLGINSVSNSFSPVQVGNLTDWKLVSTSTYNSFFVRTNGTVWSCGSNGFGQLGLGVAGGYRSSPTQIGSLTNWSVISAGASFATSIKTDGTIWSWGANTGGKLGQNIVYTQNKSSPTQIGSLTNWNTISSGDNFVVATKTDGTIWSWGSNSSGELGQNISYTINRSSPVQVGALTTWSNASAGADFAMVTRINGTLWSWGRNAFGQLGQNDVINRSSPVQVGALTDWVVVSAGNSFTLAVKTNNTLWSWGRDLSGVLGQSTVNVNKSSPVQVGSLSTWLKVSAGYNVGAAIKTDGTLWMWGAGFYGQLGQGNQVYRSSPVQVGSLTNWNQTSTGRSSSIFATQKI
jgi:alpha-tubulin suppressor-like RCC1 family protein